VLLPVVMNPTQPGAPTREPNIVAAPSSSIVAFRPTPASGNSSGSDGTEPRSYAGYVGASWSAR
jgi:hypothetical protein